MGHLNCWEWIPGSGGEGLHKWLGMDTLHNGEDHWFTISTLGLPLGHVNIYL